MSAHETTVPHPSNECDGCYPNENDSDGGSTTYRPLCGNSGGGPMFGHDLGGISFTTATIPKGTMIKSSRYPMTGMKSGIRSMGQSVSGDAKRESLCIPGHPRIACREIDRMHVPFDCSRPIFELAGHDAIVARSIGRPCVHLKGRRPKPTPLSAFAICRRAICRPLPDPGRPLRA
jgi:hypothetical protein